LLSFVDTHSDEINNPFLSLKYCDFTQDTPVEILHTILLGVVKYAWHWTHTGWKEPQRSRYSTRLQATDTKGMSIPAIRAAYITQFANSLIGRQLKILVQTNAFHVHDLVGAEQYQFIKATGVLAALLWVPEIFDMEEYVADLTTCIANVLDSAAALDPSKIIAKIKYHLLTHIPQDVRRFGPIIGVATESYESFNIIFRHCSILSNHQAPSRDIAHQLARQETFRHLVSGGWWEEASQNGGASWRQSGVALRKYVDGNAFLERIFNLENISSRKRRSTVLEAIPVNSVTSKPEPRKTYRFADTEAATAVVDDRLTITGHPPTSLWYKCKSIVASSGDECRIGNWVFARGFSRSSGPNTATIITGRITEILRLVDGNTSLAVVERFEIAGSLHERFDMPVLFRPFDEISKVAVSAEHILFNYNAQHDCYTAGCTDGGEKIVREERKDSGKTQKVIEHSKPNRYVLNTHAFHNAHHLRTIPVLKELIKPRLLYTDR
ncbi:hypothetical protein FA15DRAFT_553742, partial [Coprinopsis marcescibilis]